MAGHASASTRLSTKGQLVLPKAMRDRKQWTAGTALEVVDVPDGVLIRREPRRAAYTVDDLVGILKYEGPPVSIEQMNEAVLEMAAARYARSLHRK
jgi:AbrB family looped-hinge helix DNA binding protein